MPTWSVEDERAQDMLLLSNIAMELEASAPQRHNASQILLKLLEDGKGEAIGASSSLAHALNQMLCNTSSMKGQKVLSELAMRLLVKICVWSKATFLEHELLIGSLEDKVEEYRQSNSGSHAGMACLAHSLLLSCNKLSLGAAASYSFWQISTVLDLLSNAIFLREDSKSLGVAVCEVMSGLFFIAQNPDNRSCIMEGKEIFERIIQGWKQFVIPLWMPTAVNLEGQEIFCNSDLDITICLLYMIACSSESCTRELRVGMQDATFRALREIVEDASSATARRFGGKLLYLLSSFGESKKEAMSKLAATNRNQLAFAGYPLRSFASDRAGVSWQGERSSSWQEEREGLHAGRGGEGAAEDGEVRRSEKRRGEDGEEAAARMREEEGRLPRSFAKIVRRMGRELGMPDSKLVLNISEESLKELEHELHQHVTDARKFKENYERMLEISQNRYLTLRTRFKRNSQNVVRRIHISQQSISFDLFVLSVRKSKMERQRLKRAIQTWRHVGMSSVEVCFDDWKTAALMEKMARQIHDSKTERISAEESLAHHQNTLSTLLGKIDSLEHELGLSRARNEDLERMLREAEEEGRCEACEEMRRENESLQDQMQEEKEMFEEELRSGELELQRVSNKLGCAEEENQRLMEKIRELEEKVREMEERNGNVCREKYDDGESSIDRNEHSISPFLWRKRIEVEPAGRGGGDDADSVFSMRSSSMIAASEVEGISHKLLVDNNIISILVSEIVQLRLMTDKHKFARLFPSLQFDSLDDLTSLQTLWDSLNHEDMRGSVDHALWTNKFESFWKEILRQIQLMKKNISNISEEIEKEPPSRHGKIVPDHHRTSQMVNNILLLVHDAKNILSREARCLLVYYTRAERRDHLPPPASLAVSQTFSPPPLPRSRRDKWVELVELELAPNWESCADKTVSCSILAADVAACLGVPRQSVLPGGVDSRTNRCLLVVCSFQDMTAAQIFSLMATMVADERSSLRTQTSVLAVSRVTSLLKDVKSLPPPRARLVSSLASMKALHSSAPVSENSTQLTDLSFHMLEARCETLSSVLHELVKMMVHRMRKDARKSTVRMSGLSQSSSLPPGCYSQSTSGRSSPTGTLFWESMQNVAFEERIAAVRDAFLDEEHLLYHTSNAYDIRSTSSCPGSEFSAIINQEAVTLREMNLGSRRHLVQDDIVYVGGSDGDGAIRADFIQPTRQLPDAIPYLQS